MLSPAAVSQLVKSERSTKSQLRTFRERHKEALSTTVRSATIAGVSFGLGMVQGRTKDGRMPSPIGDIPLDATVAIAAHALGFFDVAGMGTHFHNVGDAAGAIALYNKGLEAGIGWKQKASGTQKAGGDFPSDDEMAANAAR